MSEKTSERPTKRGVGCLVVLMVALAGLSLMGLTLATLLSGFSGGHASPVSEQVEAQAEGATKKLVVMEIQGVLMDGSAGVLRPSGVTGRALLMLDRALEDSDVAGVLVVIDTPGGSVTDSDLIHERIRRLRDAGKHVVVLMGDLCASGGLYAAVAAEEIWASPTTVTGSIGVVVQRFDLHALLNTYGIEDASVTSGTHKGMLSPTRALSPESRALLQDVVNEMHARFVQLVAEGRGLSPAVVSQFADGRIFTANKAKALKLIDAIGYRRDALNRLAALTAGGPFDVVRYEVEPSFVDLLRGQARAETMAAQAWERLFAAPRAMYLYGPL